ncbi:MAG: acylneuraminate cytidylyltransferase [Sphingomonas sp.]
MAEQVLAIIPARGGSKGIPRKNVLPLAGKPLIAHTIAAARSARSVTRVVVSTDDPEIAEVSARYGAEVIWRPAELATDLAKSEDAMLHVIDTLQEREAYAPDVTVLLQCTSPLTSAEDIDGTILKLVQSGADSAFAATIFHYFLWQEDADGAAVAINHDSSVRLMRQERHPEYVETGAVYAMRTEGFRASRHRFFGRTILYETPVERRLEIDDPADFRLAEERMERLARGSRTNSLPGRIDAIVMDFDGVFTDDRVFVSQDGTESVACSRRDGMGIERLRHLGVPMVVISKERNPVVAARCQKLALEHHHGIDDKLSLMRDWLAGRNIEAADIIYVGNDRNDVACMAEAGCAMAPRDAHPSALGVADIVLDADGGRGALRLLADMIEATRGGGAT